MSRDEFEETYSEDVYTDTAMFDAEEIARSVEEVALQRRAEGRDNQSARRRFEQLVEDRRLARELQESYDDD